MQNISAWRIFFLMGTYTGACPLYSAVQAGLQGVGTRCTWDCRGSTARWYSTSIVRIIKMNLGWMLERVAVQSSQGKQIGQHKQRHQEGMCASGLHKQNWGFCAHRRQWLPRSSSHQGRLLHENIHKVGLFARSWTCHLSWIFAKQLERATREKPCKVPAWCSLGFAG